MRAADGSAFLVLTVLSVSYPAAVLRLEHLRLALTERRLPSLVAVWTLAAALTLPWYLAVSVLAVTFAAEWPTRRLVGQSGGRYLYSLGAGILARLTAYLLYHLIGGPVGAAVAMVASYSLNLVLVMAAMLAAGHRAAMRMFVDPKAHTSALASEVLGLGLAAGMTWHLWLAPAVLPALLLVHRKSLRTVMEREEAVEQDTGLLAEKTWSVTGQHYLQDNEGAVALIIIDPDDGEIQQDIVDAIRRCLVQPGDPAPSTSPAVAVRQAAPDLLGRYGSRQVAVLVHTGTSAGGPIIATAIRRSLRDANIQAVVGCATTTENDLGDLVSWALQNLMGRREAAGVVTQW